MRKMVVIGGVAAGTKTAAKAKREDPELDVTVLEAGEHVSYAGCGLPYYVGDVIRSDSQLLVRRPEDFLLTNGVRVLTGHTVTEILPGEKKVVALDARSGAAAEFPYDVLVIATGATPVRPPLAGMELDGVFTIRSFRDGVRMKRAIAELKPKAGVVVGGGLVGLEMAENLKAAGLEVHVVELLDQVLPGFDGDLARIVENHLARNGVRVLTSTRVVSFEGDRHGRLVAVRTERGEIPAEMAVVAIGVRPNVELAKRAGVELGPTGAIRVNRKMETNIPGVYAVGDCAENLNLMTHLPAWYPMGSTSNKTGRIAGINAAGATRDTEAEGGTQGGYVSDALEGVLGTTILKVFDLNVGRTGLSESEAARYGFDAVSVTVPTNDRAHYYPGYKTVIIRLVADATSHRVLGAQIVGEGVVDKPLDILVTAITLGARVEDLSKLDLAYAPPFSSAMSSVIVTANVLSNKMSGRFRGVSAKGLKEEMDSGRTIQLVDVRTRAEFEMGRIPGSRNIPLNELRERNGELDPEEDTVVVCKVGLRAYLASLQLKRAGFRSLRILEGGITAYPYDLA